MGSDPKAKANERKPAELVPPLGTSLGSAVLTLQVGAKFAGSMFSTQGAVFVLVGVKPAEALSFSSNIETELISKCWFLAAFCLLLPATCFPLVFYQIHGLLFSFISQAKVSPPPFLSFFFYQACDAKIRETSCLNQVLSLNVLNVKAKRSEENGRLFQIMGTDYTGLPKALWKWYHYLFLLMRVISF